MPGFVGICGESLHLPDGALTYAVNATSYSNKSFTKGLVDNPDFQLKKSFFGFLENHRMEAHDNGVSVYINGEIYNQSELKLGEEVFADALLRHYIQNTLQILLSKVNGIFNAIIYDTNKKILHIVTDRYGLKPIYLCHANNHLILASEVKCFSFFKSFNLQIRKDVVDPFIQLEHFLANETWLKDVEIAGPSMVYSYSWAQNKLTYNRYWNWSNIKPSNLSLDDAAEQMGELLDHAIHTCYDGENKIGVALSGGLDSRAILASIYKNDPVTYTFGTTNSKDVKIARQVAKLEGVKHIYFDTYTDHWLTSRFSGIWKTDGMLNMLHMHYSHLMEKIPRIMDINLSGFLGDAVLGGSYLEKKGRIFLNKRINSDIARHYYGVHYDRCNLNDSFFDINKIDPYLFYNRGRRMIGMGAEEPYKTVPQRLPFMDIKLMDLSYSLPDEYRANSKVYNRALLLKYTKFYTNIPHATTGVSISNNPSIFNLALKKYKRLVWIARYKLGLQTSYVNVQNWLREPATAALVNELLDPKNAIYPNYTSINFKKEFLMPHLNGKHNFVRQIMGALTMEIWLQQILNKKYIPQAPIE